MGTRHKASLRARRFGACVGRPLAPAALALLALSAACNRGPAQEAIAAAEQALAAAPQLAEGEPGEDAAIRQALVEARARLAKGRYTDALRLALPLPDRVAAAVQSAARRRQQAEAEWGALAAELPEKLAPLQARLAVLEAAGLAPERLAPAQAELAALAQAFADAGAAFERGEVTQAVAAGREVKARAEGLAGRLGLKPKTPAAAAGPQAPSPAPTPTPPPAPVG